MIQYSKEIEQQMKLFYKSLSEKDRRRYVAVESIKFGIGGKSYIYNLFGCHFETLHKGLEELKDEEKLLQNKDRIRNRGGGRKKSIEIIEGLNEAFLDALKENTAGSPMNESVKWTNLTRPKIVALLEKKGFKISVRIVDNLLKKNGFSKRKPFKNVAGTCHKDRNQQFEKIKKLKEKYNANGNPIVSMDVKKKS